MNISPNNWYSPMHRLAGRVFLTLRQQRSLLLLISEAGEEETSCETSFHRNLGLTEPVVSAIKAHQCQCLYFTDMKYLSFWKQAVWPQVLHVAYYIYMHMVLPD